MSRLGPKPDMLTKPDYDRNAAKLDVQHHTKGGPEVATTE